MASSSVFVLDYGAGNVRSLCNALKSLGVEFQVVETAEDLEMAERLIFPGVGTFGAAMDVLDTRGWREALIRRFNQNKPFLGICIGMQSLCEGSEESPGVKGLGFFEGVTVKKFNKREGPVPQIGWNYCQAVDGEASWVTDGNSSSYYYFVHSYYMPLHAVSRSLAKAISCHNETEFISVAQRGSVVGVQFHPEKSSTVGFEFIRRFLCGTEKPSNINIIKIGAHLMSSPRKNFQPKRIIAGLDVRASEDGKRIVTKGDGYDVMENSKIRNLGDPVELAREYFKQGADEICFLNIMSFMSCPISDLPMLAVLEKAAEEVFVPLTVGGGLRNYTDSNGVFHSAVDVAGAYFRAGADKVSIGSAAVHLVEEAFLLSSQNKENTQNCIEQISRIYGSQAVVISVDPRRVYVVSPDDVKHKTLETKRPGPNGETFCWYQCTTKGGRDARDIGVDELVQTVEEMGAGEILLNCIDTDGKNNGFDLELINFTRMFTCLPIIASSGAGTTSHFVQVFKETDVQAALAAGIFHRKQVTIGEVKQECSSNDIPIRKMENNYNLPS